MTPRKTLPADLSSADVVRANKRDLLLGRELTAFYDAVERGYGAMCNSLGVRGLLHPRAQLALRVLKAHKLITFDRKRHIWDYVPPAHECFRCRSQTLDGATCPICELPAVIHDAMVEAGCTLEGTDESYNVWWTDKLKMSRHRAATQAKSSGSARFCWVELEVKGFWAFYAAPGDRCPICNASQKVKAP